MEVKCYCYDTQAAVGVHTRLGTYVKFTPGNEINIQKVDSVGTSEIFARVFVRSTLPISPPLNAAYRLQGPVTISLMKKI